jgi:hypothetical protein
LFCSQLCRSQANRSDEFAIDVAVVASLAAAVFAGAFEFKGGLKGLAFPCSLIAQDVPAAAGHPLWEISHR